MTTQQLHMFNLLALVLLVVVGILTRATARRVIGALAGGAAAGVAVMGIIALGQQVGWWHMAIAWEPYFLTLLWIDFALSAFPFLITWRIARRFGWRGLAVAVVFAAVIGPPRDYWYMERFPEWGVYAPRVAPVLAVSATYVLLLVVGHGVMRLVAGPAGGSPLARRPWEPAEPGVAADPARHVAFWDKPPRGGAGSMEWDLMTSLPIWASPFFSLAPRHWPFTCPRVGRRKSIRQWRCATNRNDFNTKIGIRLALGQTRMGVIARFSEMWQPC